MYHPITNLLITMCFTNLIQIQIIPTITGPTSPMYISTENHRQTTSGNFSRHTYTSKQLWAIHDQVNPTSLTNLPFGSIQRIRELQLNRNHQPSEPTKINIPNQKGKLKSGISDRYQQSAEVIDEIVQTIRVSTVNARSLKHKENLISEEIHNTNSDITIITETWLENTDEGDTWMLSSELTNNSYQISKK